MAAGEQWRKLQDQISLSHIHHALSMITDRLWHGAIELRPLDGQDWAAAVDLVCQQDCFILKADLPGMDGSQVDLRIENDRVYISGQRISDRPDGSSEQFMRTERRFGKFRRVIQLPDPIDQDAVTATFSKGVLTMMLPRKQQYTGCRIEVKDLDSF